MLDVARARGVEIETIPSMRRSVHLGEDARAVAEVGRVLRRLKPDIVHTHTAKAGAIGRTAARLAGVPLVLHTFHGHVFDGYFSERKTSAFLAVERGLARLTDRILAISERQRQDLVERYRIAPAEKVGVVPLGLDLGRFAAVEPRRPAVGRLRAELGISPAAPVIVTVGRLVPIKRFDLLIDAFRAALEQLPGARLVIVGEGECRAELEARAAGHPSIHFTGLRRDLEHVYADADLMVLSSDNEGTPVAVIEALASGLPVVATDVGGVRDVVPSGAGTIVPPGDARALAEALHVRLRAQSTLQDAHRQDVLRRYSHRRLIEDMENLYDRLVLERGRSRGRWMLERTRRA
jgi:glycosyltransferase involved in cell wall biosynthesis